MLLHSSNAAQRELATTFLSHALPHLTLAEEKKGKTHDAFEICLAAPACPRPRDLCGGREPSVTTRRTGGLALHARLDVRIVLGRSLQDLDPQSVRERLLHVEFHP